MISKDKIAHDLTKIYLRNKSNVDVEGSLFSNGDDLEGQISTTHLPSPDEKNYVQVSREYKKFFKRTTVQETVEQGNKIDPVISRMTGSILFPCSTVS